ncbi:VOC family protein [Pararhizobium antarcticum]|uniref:Glyoxalase n=1 Tax=Pararhizobium antarcticum TaxID=1798805 RepID=A0A657LX82_9HYPH|nr:VOC family protein [Pararhizobium antarcticum]OJF90330.1 glyoxalase [Rhizobium sp. 58]OJG00608.1 glyoxalase [Pararhizobium antarcticum]
MLLYITLGSNDLAKATVFYDAALAPLGLVRRVTDAVEIGYGAEADSRCRLWIVSPYDKKPATIGNGSMVALEAESRALVDAFYAAAMAHGGTDEGKPGLRPYHADFYAAYVRDPDGNKLSAVCELTGQV